MARFTRLLIVAGVGSGCGFDPSEGGGSLTFHDTDFQPLQISDRAPPPSDAATAAAATVDGDRLRIALRFSGGCRIHRFAVYADRGVGESLPPFVRIHLIHDRRGDACEALVGRNLEVDLTSLKRLIAPAREARLALYLGAEPAGLPEVRYRY